MPQPAQNANQPSELVESSSRVREISVEEVSVEGVELFEVE